MSVHERAHHGGKSKHVIQLGPPLSPFSWYSSPKYKPSSATMEALELLANLIRFCLVKVITAQLR